MSGEDLNRIECPNCGKGFDVAGPSWGESVLCPYCGAEIDG
jgi:uncharacterized Zn-finger protein